MGGPSGPLRLKVRSHAAIGRDAALRRVADMSLAAGRLFVFPASAETAFQPA
jgi:hypothetical protein